MVRRIDDHKSWVGSSTDGSVLPMGAKKKMESNEEGAGELTDYYDTSEKIASDQRQSVAKVKSNAPQTGFRH